MRKSLIFYVCLSLFVFGCIAQKSKEVKTDVTLTLTPSQKLDFQFLGHGVQWSAYPHADAEDAEWGLLMTNEKWEELYTRLDFINPRIIRVMDVATWRYYEGLDANGHPIVNFDTQEIKSLYKLLDYCQSRKVPVLFGEWGAPGLWNLDESIPEIEKADDPRWASMIVAYLKHLIFEKDYTCIQYYNLVNEPNGYWASTDGDWDEWKAGYKGLYQAFKDAGLSKYVSLAGPDAVTQWDHPTHSKKAHDWVYSTVTELNDETALYDFHIYANQDMIRSGDFVTYLEPFVTKIRGTDKPLILGELGMKYTGDLYEENLRLGKEDPFAGPDDSSMFVYDFFYGVDMADAAVQSMLAGVAGTIAWDLDDAMHTVGDLGQKDQLKKWGMWNILSEEFGNKEEDKTPRPWSYTWTLLCQLFPPESTVYKPKFSVPNDSIRAVAAVKNDNVSLALVNQSKEAQSIVLQTNMLSDIKKMSFYEYAEDNKPVNKAGFPIMTKEIRINSQSANTIKLYLKGRSALFLSTIVLDKQ